MNEVTRTAPIKNIKLLNGGLETGEQGNIMIEEDLKKYEVLVELRGFKKRQLFGQCHTLLFTVNRSVNMPGP